MQDFIYAVSLARVTEESLQIDEERRAYLHEPYKDLCTPLTVGLGIENREQFEEVTGIANGAIISGAFLQAIEEATLLSLNLLQLVRRFIPNLR